MTSFTENVAGLDGVPSRIGHASGFTGLMQIFNDTKQGFLARQS